MSVKPILLQKDGAIKGVPGAYRTSPPPLAGPYAGSDALEDVTYYTVNASGEAELKTVKAYPFYVDSISGGADTSGYGTELNPWRSVNYALAQIQPILACLSLKSCCTYLVLRVKGAVDYTVQYLEGNTYFNGYNKLIFEPWGNDNFIIDITPAERHPIFSSAFIAMSYLTNIIIKKMKLNFNVQSELYGNIDVILRCNGCHFDESEINAQSNSVSRGFSYGLYESLGIIAYNTSVNINFPYYSPGYAIGGFYTCDDSIFYNVNSNIYGKGFLAGFYVNRNSIFNNCNGSIYGLSDTSDNDSGCGFSGNTNSIFLNCTGNSLNRTDCDI